MNRWLERFELADRRDSKIQTLSKGMSQKVQFISTVIAEPELIILDEPFSGLDPVNMEAMRQAILDLSKRGSDGDLLDPRHDGRRADLRPRVHDLQG